MELLRDRLNSIDNNPVDPEFEYPLEIKLGIKRDLFHVLREVVRRNPYREETVFLVAEDIKKESATFMLPNELAVGSIEAMYFERKNTQPSDFVLSLYQMFVPQEFSEFF